MFFTLFSSLVCITVQVLFTQPPNSNKLLTFSFLQPQMNPFYLYIKILKPHILSQRIDSWPSIIFYLVDLVKGPPTYFQNESSTTAALLFGGKSSLPIFALPNNHHTIHGISALCHLYQSMPQNMIEK